MRSMRCDTALFLNYDHESNFPFANNSYNILINGLCKYGLMDCAIGFLDQMIIWNYSLKPI